MAIAGSAKPCFWFEVINGELHKTSLRQEMSTETTSDVDKIIERLKLGERVAVFARYPTPQEVWDAWEKRR